MKTTEAFESAYSSLNTRQREAVDAIEGPVMVIAGPGTGKTNILTLRIANILARTDTPAEAILALTFTESGAAEMKGRLAALIGTDAYRVTVTTFHSFCNSIIQEYPESFGAIAGAASITEADQALYLQRILEEHPSLPLLRPVNAPDLYLKAIVGAINTLKREGITPERLIDVATREESIVMSSDDLYHEKGAYKGVMKGAYQDQLKQVGKVRELSDVYTRYQALLRAERLYDYNDMVMEAARVLASDESLRLMLQEKHHYLLVDEHQDTNNAQNKVVELLASFWERPNVFVVGDAKQAIYRFQGASLENFLYFQKLYPDAQLIELEDNYRSHQHILDAAQGIRPSAGSGLRAQAERESTTPVLLMTCDNPDEECWMIARHISERIEQGARPDDIAVLVRDNAGVARIAEFLQRQAVPYSISSQQDALSDPYLHQLTLILDAVRAFGESRPLYEALHTPVLAIDPLDVYKLIECCRGGRNPYDIMRSSPAMHEAGIEYPDALQQLASRMTHWSRLMAQPESTEALETIIRESGVLASLLRSVDAPDSLARLHAFYDMLRSHVQRNRALTLAQFVEHLDFLREHRIPVHAPQGALAPHRVRVMTVHKSKGLEFSYVYIIDTVDSRWGSRKRRELIKLPPSLFVQSRATAPIEDDDDERNLFYVALTRARHEVVIAHSTHTLDGGEELPARYISDINPTLVSHIDTNAFRALWLQEQSKRFDAAPQRVPLATDKTFLNELFNRYGLSVTALNNYLTCPWRYFYTNLIRIPEASSFALMYGNAVDRALQEYFDAYVAGEKKSKEHLVQLFERFLQHQPMQSSELEAGRARGRKALEGYYEKYHTTWHPRILNQLKIPAVEIGDGIILNGKIDKVDMNSDGSVIVIDYKTGKPKSRAHIVGSVKDGDGNYFRQLTFYKLLLDRWQDGTYKTHTGVIDFVEPDDRGKWHREVFELSSSAVQELEESIVSVAHEIRELSFWNRRCSDTDCAYCTLRNVIEIKTTPR